jgi:hypothetical protein
MKTVEVICKYIDPEKHPRSVLYNELESNRILDAGAGTGLVGELLFEKGFHDLVGGT